MTAPLWQGLPLPEQRRFLRHVRPYWDSHRHRMAPASAQAFGQLLDRGALVLKRGRVRSITLEPGPSGPAAPVALQDRGCTGAETMVAQRVLYATGPGRDAVQDDLVSGLVSMGLARTDAHGMGLDVSSTLQLLDDNGQMLPGVWALGPLVRGVFWECTAVPDIRLQARMIATEVARALHPPSPERLAGN